MIPAHSGYLMVRMANQHFQSIAANPLGMSPLGTVGSFRPMFADSHVGTINFLSDAATGKPRDWMLHLPVPMDEHPWDIAHKFARGQMPSSAHLAAQPGLYVEPDLLGLRYSDAIAPLAQVEVAPAPKNANKVSDPKLPTPSGNPLIAAYPPVGDETNPGWHLGSEFTNFVTAWKDTKGSGIRIAHLDVGITPTHVSAPVNLLLNEGYNVLTNNTDVTDHGVHVLLDNPGHGTGTLGLLAGNRVNIVYKPGGAVWNDFVGGAPEASIVPVVIGHSVIHLYSADLAQGLTYALGSDTRAKCDVVSLSHGGLPSATWAEAVNRLYEAGVVVVAASGDSYDLKLFDIATHYTVYPSAFYRVVTATGATSEYGPYKESKFPPVMQGCWGPKKVSEKSIAAYTPNVPWMRFNTEREWDIDGGGTSASTPQIAAACALWLAKYGNQFPAGYRRVNACRHALFSSASHREADVDHIGVGILDAAKMLSPETHAEVLAAQAAGKFEPMISEAATSFAIWRLLFGFPPAGTGIDEMYETEALQIFHRSINPIVADLVQNNPDLSSANLETVKPSERQAWRDAFLAEPSMSNELRRHLTANGINV